MAALAVYMGNMPQSISKPSCPTTRTSIGNEYRRLTKEARGPNRMRTDAEVRHIMDAERQRARLMDRAVKAVDREYKNYQDAKLQEFKALVQAIRDVKSAKRPRGRRTRIPATLRRLATAAADLAAIIEIDERDSERIPRA